MICEETEEYISCDKCKRRIKSEVNQCSFCDIHTKEDKHFCDFCLDGILVKIKISIENCYPSNKVACKNCYENNKQIKSVRKIFKELYPMYKDIDEQLEWSE